MGAPDTSPAAEAVGIPSAALADAIDPAAASDFGMPLRAIYVDENTAICTARVAQLKTFIHDPVKVEKNKGRDPEMAEYAHLREAMQRMATKGGKKANVAPYADYLNLVSRRQKDAYAPPMTLWCAAKARFTKDGLRIVLPYDAPCVFVDGETQWVAWLSKGDECKAQQVMVVLLHNRSMDDARQIFRDCNVEGVKVSKSLALNMDSRDPGTMLARAVHDHVDFFTDRVKVEGRQLNNKDKAVIMMTALRTAVACYLRGTAGFALTTESIPELSVLDAERCKPDVIAWFRTLADDFATEIEDRSRYILHSGAALAAACAVRNRCSSDHEAVRLLKEVDWSRGNHWLGIAGKPSAKGDISFGGPKEFGGHIYRALSDATSDTYQQVRGSRSSALSEGVR